MDDTTREEPAKRPAHSPSGERSGGERKEPRSKSNRALIVVDLAPGLALAVAEAKTVSDVVRYVQGELRYFRERDRLVVFSVPAHAVAESSAPVMKELTPRAHEVVLTRPGPSVFSSSGLDERLREAGVKRITLVGIGTARTIAVSAIDALARGYGVTVPDPCVCDVSVEDHKAALHLIREVWTPLYAGAAEERDEVTAPGVAFPERS